ncbi:fructosamine kinase family protein [Puia sp.]|uniref:fructosamine kinase family protein n=1 Tax=Puia sp. TaxID=2045100 RepID=UPI0039C921BF
MRQVGRGSINAAYQLSTNHNSRWFAKFNETRSFPQLFVREATGLALLQCKRIIRIPETIACL